jgi:hypothetical protein
MNIAHIINTSTGLIVSCSTSSSGAVAIPSGYVMCDGSAYPKTMYPKLAAILGKTYGGDYSVFRVPDLRGKLSDQTEDWIKGYDCTWDELEQLTTPDGWDAT